MVFEVACLDLFIQGLERFVERHLAIGVMQHVDVDLVCPPAAA